MSFGCNSPGLIKINKIHSFFKADFKSDYSFKGERHSYWEMVFVLKGSVGVTAQSDVYVLNEGQAIIHRPDEFHKIRSEFSSLPAVIVISFSAESFPDFSGRIFNVELLVLEQIQKLYEFSLDCFERSNIYLTAVKDTVKAQQLWLKCELLIFSVICGTSAYRGEMGTKMLKGAELYSMAVKFMEENPDGSYCTSDIAAKFSISSAYLKKIFQKYSGCGVMQYYNRLKVRVACSYLEQGKSVKETAALLGFGDQNYFSNFFKRVMGQSPTKYKKSETGK